ncbi:MAG TPA: methylated-DNA--[protein]-cysteine S-methyltransferase [Micromonospora sp.]|nr:methylated-DNA--[protein]-cysteine S-methyltransferase [Micromonospora sp.]
MRWAVVDSPIGVLSLAVDEVGVCRVEFGPVEPARPTQPAHPTPDRLAAAIDELGAYFAGERTEFGVPLSVRHGSDFERAVWREISAIPYGETRTYGAVAATLGEPGAARAVGAACNRNPIPVIVPCHRIVGAGGKLVGFGGGLPRKRYLLELEACITLQRAWS